MKQLLRAPFLYPFYGLFFLVVRRPDLGLRAVVSALLQIVNPFMWLSPRLVARSHAKFFGSVFEAASGAPLLSSSSPSSSASSPSSHQLTQEQRARLDAAVAAATAQAQAKAQAEAEAARRRRELLRGQRQLSMSSLPSSPSEAFALVRSVVTEPESHFPWPVRMLARWLRRAVVVPLALAFPLAAKLLLSPSSSSTTRVFFSDTRGVAVDALRPWLKAKGLKLRRAYGSGASVAPPGVVDDACVFERRMAWEARAFGAVALLLGLFPLLSWLLNYLSTTGAALWAADLERLEGGGVRVLVPPPAVPAPAAKGAEREEAAATEATAAAASKQEL